MTTRIALLGLLAAWFLTGCSTHYYEGEPPRTASEVKAYLNEVSGAQGQGVGGGVSAAMQSQQTAVIYYGESSSYGIASLLSFFSFDWLTGSTGSVGWNNINGGRVFMLDNMSVDGTIGLVIGIDNGNGYTYYGYSGKGELKDDLFRATLTGSNGTIAIESIDNDGSVLDDIIQLRVYVQDASGERYAGKISTLFAYQ